MNGEVFIERKAEDLIDAINKQIMDQSALLFYHGGVHVQPMILMNLTDLQIIKNWALKKSTGFVKIKHDHKYDSLTEILGCPVIISRLQEPEVFMKIWRDK